MEKRIEEMVMRNHVFFIGILFFFMLFSASCSNDKAVENDIKVAELIQSEATAPPPPPLRLGPGDEITVTVWRHDDLTRNEVIDPVGNISFPLIGVIKASGLTVPVLEQKITGKLSKYFVDPQVNVSVKNLSNYNIYVLGEVNSPAAYSLKRRLSAIEAIAQAEGFKEDANEEGVLLVRGKDGVAEVVALNLDLRQMNEDGKQIQNVQLKNKDILYVPPKGIVDVERFMVRLSNILRPILDIERGIVMGRQTYDVLRGKDIPAGVLY
jgi:polysaccharide export outer membrane protein